VVGVDQVTCCGAGRRAPVAHTPADAVLVCDCSIWGGRDCIVGFEHGSSLLRLYEPELDKSAVVMVPAKQYRHDSPLASHTIIAVVYVTEKSKLVSALPVLRAVDVLRSSAWARRCCGVQVTTSVDTMGVNHISFWNTETMTLLHREVGSAL
jgi:hypothetical protein